MDDPAFYPQKLLGLVMLKSCDRQSPSRLATVGVLLKKLILPARKLPRAVKKSPFDQ